MDKVIGLGRMGCAVAEELSAHPEYRIYKIDAQTSERVSLSLGVFRAWMNMKAELTKTIAIYLRSIKDEDDVL